MKYEATITLEEKEEAGQVEELFRPEEKNFSNNRSSYEVERTKKGLKFKARAEDATALKATLVSITKNLQVYEEMKGVQE